MRIKKFLYSFLKYPLIIIFLKTPFFYILNKRFKFYRKYVAIKNKNFFWQVLDTVYQKEYFDKIIDKDSIRKISDSTFTEGHGKKWAKNYFESHFVDLDGLNNQRVGLLSTNDALPIFSDIINYVKTNKLEESDDTYIIQLGSSSGRDINFFYNIFPKLNYISTDINDEILDYQREQYKHTSLNFYKCHAENIDKCIEEFQLKDKRIILFSSGSLNYVNPYFLKEFFLKIKKYHNLEFFCVSL